MSVESDNTMINIYENMYKILSKNKNYIIKLKCKFDEINIGDYSKKLNFIFDEIEFMIQGFEMCFIACENRHGIKQSFFNLTTFNRASLSSTVIIYDKLKKVMVKNKYFSKEIKKRFDNIEKSILKIAFFRNKIEHDIDPYYHGIYDEVGSEFNIEKQLSFIRKVLDLLRKLSDYELNISSKEFKINYKQTSLKYRKEIISNMQNQANEIFLYTVALSHILEDNQMYMNIGASLMQNNGKSRSDIRDYINDLATSDEERIIIDLAFKTIELQKAVYFIYENKVILRSNLLDREIYSYKYFLHMCLIISYQIFDKIGLLFKERLLLECEYTYFKQIVDEIVEKELIQDDICKEICMMKKSNDYGQLSKIRNYMVHEYGIVAYQCFENELDRKSVV